jgi:hypothetical protein
MRAATILSVITHLMGLAMACGKGQIGANEITHQDIDPFLLSQAMKPETDFLDEILRLANKYQTRLEASSGERCTILQKWLQMDVGVGSSINIIYDLFDPQLADSEAEAIEELAPVLTRKDLTKHMGLPLPVSVRKVVLNIIDNIRHTAMRILSATDGSYMKDFRTFIAASLASELKRTEKLYKILSSIPNMGIQLIDIVTMKSFLRLSMVTTMCSCKTRRY